MDFAGLIEIKSKFDAEFRRFSIASTAISTFRDFYQLLERRHGLYSIPFVIQYVDPKDNDLLPINNDENLARALKVTTTLLRLLLQRKGESYGEINGYRSSSQGIRGKKAAADLVRSMGGSERKANHDRAISLLDDFRKVSSIIDIDIVPETMRRVRLIRSDAKPLGFFIRDGVSVRVTPTGIERVPGIFISRLNPGGLAESTGLLAVNDEVVEVNGIEVRGKSLDQVTDMMVANSSNLIITVKPVNQNTCLPPRRQAQSGPLGSIGSPIYGGGNSTEPLRTGLSSGPQRNSGRNAPSGFVGGMSSNHKLHSPTSDIAASQSATHRASPVAISKPASGWSSLSSDQLTRSARGNGSGRALPHTGNQQPQSIYPSGTLMNGGRHDIHLDENTRTPDDRKNQYITVSAAPKNTATRLNSPHSMGPVLDGRNIVQHVEEKPARGCDNVGLITL